MRDSILHAGAPVAMDRGFPAACRMSPRGAGQRPAGVGRVDAARSLRSAALAGMSLAAPTMINRLPLRCPRDRRRRLWPIPRRSSVGAGMYLADLEAAPHGVRAAFGADLWPGRVADDDLPPRPRPTMPTTASPGGANGCRARPDRTHRCRCVATMRRESTARQRIRDTRQATSPRPILNQPEATVRRARGGWPHNRRHRFGVRRLSHLPDCSKDLIISGMNICPRAQSRSLHHPAVRAVAAVGRPDPTWASRSSPSSCRAGDAAGRRTSTACLDRPFATSGPGLPLRRGAADQCWKVVKRGLRERLCRLRDWTWRAARRPQGHAAYGRMVVCRANCFVCQTPPVRV